MTSSPSQAPAAGKSPSTVPDGLALFRHWLETEGAKGWDALDTAPDSGYEKVWRAWLRSLGDVGMSAKEDPPPPPPPQGKNKGEAPAPPKSEKQTTETHATSKHASRLSLCKKKKTDN